MRAIPAISVMFFVAMIGGCANQPTPNEQLAQRAEKEVANTMKDPTSVKFQGVVASAKANCIRGKLLAKNSMGAYTGYHDFVWINGETAVSIDQSEVIDHTAYLKQLTDYIDKDGRCFTAFPNGTGPDRQSNIPDT